MWFCLVAGFPHQEVWFRFSSVLSCFPTISIEITYMWECEGTRGEYSIYAAGDKRDYRTDPAR